MLVAARGGEAGAWPTWRRGCGVLHGDNLVVHGRCSACMQWQEGEEREREREQRRRPWWRGARRGPAAQGGGRARGHGHGRGPGAQPGRIAARPRHRGGTGPGEVVAQWRMTRKAGERSLGGVEGLGSGGSVGEKRCLEKKNPWWMRLSLLKFGRI